MTSIAVVMPLYDALPHLEDVLPPLAEALARGAIQEVLVVDDSSTDRGPERCRAAGFRVLPSGGRLGPGGCRNIGAVTARGDVLLFLDSDVVMHADVPEKVRAVFEARPDVVAVFGSYDDAPRAPGVVSKYRNLLHHYTHQKGREEASTFWAGCGAVRRAPYLEVGGFNSRRYGRPSIEDIELGYRLRRQGRILLCRDIQGTHLKRWTLRNMLETDIFKRALPWSRLLLRSRSPADLNVSPAERVRALLALLFWVAWAACLVAPGASLPWAAGTTLFAFLANLEFLRLVRRRCGPLCMIGSLFLHQLYYLYSSSTYAWCVLEKLVAPRRALDGSDPAPLA